MADTLQLLVQSEDELRKREALAGVGVDVHLGDDGGRRERWTLGAVGRLDPCPMSIESTSPLQGIAAFADQGLGRVDQRTHREI